MWVYIVRRQAAKSLGNTKKKKEVEIGKRKRKGEIEAKSEKDPEITRLRVVHKPTAGQLK